MRDNSLLVVIKRVFCLHRFVRDHEDDDLEQGSEVRSAIGSNHGRKDSTNLMVRAALLENEVTEVLDHVVKVV